MSEIDIYRHECLGVIMCPTKAPYFSLVPNTKKERVPKEEFLEEIPILQIPVYRLLEDVNDSSSSVFGGAGYIVVGGGSGEVRGVSIDINQWIMLQTDHPDADQDKWGYECFKTFWTDSKMYIICTGLERLGWSPSLDSPARFIARHVAHYLLDNFPEEYNQFCGEAKIDELLVPCIVSRLNSEQDKFWNYQKDY